MKSGTESFMHESWTDNWKFFFFQSNFSSFIQLNHEIFFLHSQMMGLQWTGCKTEESENALNINTRQVFWWNGRDRFVLTAYKLDFIAASYKFSCKKKWEN
jgi:hypothetical protein